MNKVEICEAGPVAFPEGPFDPFADNVDADAQFGRVALGIGG